MAAFDPKRTLIAAFHIARQWPQIDEGSRMRPLVKPKDLNLKYALGEIFLIVVGVSIALAASSWYEDRQEGEAEFAYLISLREDLHADLEQLNIQIDGLDRKRQAIDVVLSVIDSETEPEDMSAFLRHLRRIASADEFIPNSTTFSELSGVGGLAILKDREIVRAVIQYLQRAEIVRRYDLIAADNRRSVGSLTVYDFLDAPTWTLITDEVFDLNQGLKSPSDPIEGLTDPASKLSVERMRNNNEYRNAVYRSSGMNVVLRRSKIELRTQCQNIVDSLDLRLSMSD